MWPLPRRRAHKARNPFARLRCSFCRREADDVGRLVAGASAYICDNCITACVAILREHGGFDEPTGPQRPQRH